MDHETLQNLTITLNVVLTIWLMGAVYYLLKRGQR
jgi:hypothetical protein